MHNFRDEIPLRALLNSAIIDRVVESSTFKQAVGEVLTLAGSPGLEYQFKNPAFIAGFLYCVIAVPKEIWISSPEDPVYRRLEASKVVDLFDIRIKDIGFDSHPAYFLIHRLRNAIAHANFEIDQSQAFVFRDRRGKGGSDFWEAWVSNANLFRFLNEVAHAVEEMYPAGKRSAVIH